MYRIAQDAPPSRPFLDVVGMFPKTIDQVALNIEHTLAAIKAAGQMVE